MGFRASRRPRRGSFGLAFAAALAVGACSSFPSISSLTGGGASPFSSSSLIDRTFIGAAQTWDTDKNGSVTCDEWKGYVLGLMKESDANGDGQLDQTEFQSMARTDRLFDVADLSYFDANGDSRASPDELTGKQNVAFKALDKNGDCQIDRNETVTVIQRDKPKDTSPAQAPGGGAPGY